MTFEFLIACSGEPSSDINVLLLQLLSEALEANQYDFNDNALLDMLQVTHMRGSRSNSQEILIGFTVELDEVESAQAVIIDFARSLVGSGPIYHAIRFDDPLLQEELAGISAEIFGLEMKLRRVLSFIYLHAYPNNPYELLREENQVTPTIPRGLTEQQLRNVMENLMENQFFHLTFRQYIQLNQRRALGPAQLIDTIAESDSYDGLRAKLLSAPITHEDDIELLADLKRLLDPIERMRNCVAHNRRPDTDTREDYAIARPQLDERLDHYLNELEPA